MQTMLISQPHSSQSLPLATNPSMSAAGLEANPVNHVTPDKGVCMEKAEKVSNEPIHIVRSFYGFWKV